MTRIVTYDRPHAVSDTEWLPGLTDATTRLYRHLTTAVGPSGRATVDLDVIGRRLGLRPLTWRVALCVLRERGWLTSEHDGDRFALATITLLGGLE